MNEWNESLGSDGHSVGGACGLEALAGSDLYECERRSRMNGMKRPGSDGHSVGERGLEALAVPKLWE